ncbi:MAG: alginate lyase family protein [Cyclobacteriaceae bacterium]
MKKVSLLIAVLFLEVICVNLYAQQVNSGEDHLSQAELLLSRIDLRHPGLEHITSAENQEEALQELLAYYKERKQVKHELDRFSKAEKLGDYATEKDLKIANDALEHVFVGQPAYPSYFCGEDIDWSSRPVPDMEWVWQLNRMSFWEAMGKAYWHTGDSKYAEEWRDQLIDWVKKNPRDEAHKYAWRSIEAGIRGNRWTRLFQYFIDDPSFTPEVLAYFLNSLHEHASYLMTKYSSGSNWALMEAEGMAYIAITFPEFKDADTWREEAFRRLNEQIHTQVYSDGHQRELAMGYHVGSIRWFMRTYELAAMNGLQDRFPDAYLSTIEKMCEVPMKLGFPDGTTTQFGDSWSGKPGQYDHLFESWAEVFDRSDFLYMATGGQSGAVPEGTAFAYPESGLYSMRSGWSKEDICMVLKCGPDGGGHCQPDNGTFELYAGGRHLMPDAGSYIYSGDPVNRAWFRQTKVHQTLTLNGENSVYAPQLLKWQPGESLDVLVVENESYQELTHRRAMLFVDKKFFVVVDDAYGPATGDIDIHFQLAPGKAVFNKKKLTVGSDFDEGWNVLVKTQKQKNILLQEEEGQVSFEYTKKEPRPAFRFGLIKEATQSGVRFVTVVYPYKASIPDVKIKDLSKTVTNANEVVLQVSINGNKRKISYQID